MQYHALEAFDVQLRCLTGCISESLMYQVMAEAANEGILSIIEHCHTHRILPVICKVICTDRNPKLRQYCTSYLLQVPKSSHAPPLLHMKFNLCLDNKRRIQADGTD